MENEMKVLRFTASWCSPCKMLAATLEDVKTDIPFEVVDIDVHPEVAQSFGVRGVPTLVMVNEAGVESKRSVGMKSAKDLQEWLSV